MKPRLTQHVLRGLALMADEFEATDSINNYSAEEQRAIWRAIEWSQAMRRQATPPAATQERREER